MAQRPCIVNNNFTFDAIQELWAQVLRSSFSDFPILKNYYWTNTRERM